jgi:HK97 family phage major capsid protein
MDTPEVTALLTKAAAKVEQLSEKITELDAEKAKQEKKNADLQAQLSDLAQKLAEHPSGAGAQERVQGGFRIDVEALQQDPGFKALQRGDKHARISLQIEGLSVKTLVSDLNGVDTANGTIAAVAPRDPGYYGYAFRPPSLLSLLPSRPISSNAYEFVRLSFSGDADVQAEGERKAEMDFTGDTETAKVQTIAVLATASKQILDDIATLRQELGRIMIEKVRAKADLALIDSSGTGANYIEGLNTQSVAINTLSNAVPDRIGEALVAMQSAGYYPTVILMHPDEWFHIQSMKDAEGRYLYGDPATPAPPSLWNLPVVTTPNLAVGRALLVDATKVLVLDREQINLAISFENNDNFERNLVTLRAEMRIGLAVFDTAAVRRIDLTAAT